MLVATCVIKLQLDSVFSLKEKRRIVKSIVTRLSQQFNVAIAEVAAQDVWQTAVLGLATVGTESAHLHAVLQNAVSWLEKNRPDVPITHYEIELF